MAFDLCSTEKSYFIRNVFRYFLTNFETNEAFQFWVTKSGSKLFLEFSFWILDEHPRPFTKEVPPAGHF